MIVLLCPICHKRRDLRDLSEAPHFPFCSQRCRWVDLGRWLNEEYQMPARPLDEEVDEGVDPVP